MTTIVWAPGDLVVANSEGVDVRLAGVEITADIPHHLGRPAGERGIRVHVAGVTSPLTMDLDNRHLQEVEAWAEERKRVGPENVHQFPVMPGVAVLSAVNAVITDNHDTDYRWVGGQLAGTGSEWDGSWAFVPEPPAGVKHLSIEFTVDGVPTGKSVRVQLG
ncbi:hypothetical protein JOF48_003289 [Arthrobacter stackebrandtii]|uniref:Uncharacterized protein n=1 Tax=Arthrobacter stackebrandtii TaxID=272161 RepID=A0ABS4Z0A2_9MICC|nr:hypothetical protein [Arthrobacter stackebrandtii]MBP2414490.1 hypothetical protein [Arthrobacter stackebrandtii]